MKAARIIWTVFPVLLVTSCAKRARVSVPAAPAIGYSETGIASWYGHPYHGRPSSSGETYDMEKLTAAHRTLPFGTRVRVRNLENGETVVVRINDRGPFVDGRVIDLSRAAARRIRMLGPGTARVRLVVIGVPEQPSASGYYGVQLGAFRNRGNAERLRARMEERYGTARVVEREGNPRLYRVVVGRAGSAEEAAALAARLRGEAGAVFVVRVDLSTAAATISDGGHVR